MGGGSYGIYCMSIHDTLVCYHSHYGVKMLIKWPKQKSRPGQAVKMNFSRSNDAHEFNGHVVWAKSVIWVKSQDRFLGKVKWSRPKIGGQDS